MSIREIIKAALIGVPILLSGCASIVSGTTDEIRVNSDPCGAKCDLTKDNVTIAKVESTPASVLVKRDYANITVECRKEGFLTGNSTVSSGLNGWTFGNVLLGFAGIVGVIIDSSDLAMFDYDSSTTVALTPLPAQTVNNEQVINE